MDSINELKPGEKLTPEQKEKLAKDNADASADAQRLAAEHRARDQAEGKGEPAVKVVADILKDKLMRGDFQKKDDTKTNQPPANS